MQKIWLACVGVALAATVSAQTTLTPPTTDYALTWNASLVDSTHPAPDRYEWQIQPGPTFANVGLSTTVPMPALANGSYTAQVRACLSASCSPTTDLPFTVSTAAPAVPGAPGGVQIVRTTGPAPTLDYRNHSQTTYASRSGSTTVPIPAGTAVGDTLLFVFVDGRNPAPSTTIGPPPGFSPLPGFPSSMSVSGFQVDLRAYYKIAAANEPTTYTITHTGAALSTQAMLIAVSGGSGVPMVTVRKGTGQTGTATGLTTTVPNTAMLFIEHNWELYGSSVPPTGATPTFTERSDLSSSLLYLASGVMATPGATGNKAHGNGNIATNEGWQSVLIAVAP